MKGEYNTKCTSILCSTFQPSSAPLKGIPVFQVQVTLCFFKNFKLKCLKPRCRIRAQPEAHRELLSLSPGHHQAAPRPAASEPGAPALSRRARFGLSRSLTVKQQSRNHTIHVSALSAEDNLRYQEVLKWRKWTI